jgi:hypothetical protein
MIFQFAVGFQPTLKLLKIDTILTKSTFTGYHTAYQPFPSRVNIT